MARSDQAFGRYALPMVPFVCLWAAIGTMAGVRFVHRSALPTWARASLIAGLIGVVLLPPLWSSVQFGRSMGVKTTQALAWEWISSHVRAGARIVSDVRGLELPPERFGVTAVKSVEGLDSANLPGGGADLVLMSSDSWAPDDGLRQAPSRPPATYAGLLQRAAKITTISPTLDHPGPEILILQMGR
jgi:hypothetical protein